MRIVGGALMGKEWGENRVQRFRGGTIGFGLKGEGKQRSQNWKQQRR